MNQSWIDTSLQKRFKDLTETLTKFDVIKEIYIVHFDNLPKQSLLEKITQENDNIQFISFEKLQFLKTARQAMCRLSFLVASFRTTEITQTKEFLTSAISKNNGINLNFVDIIFWPMCTTISKFFLKNKEPILEQPNQNIRQFKFDLIQLDKDLLSQEYPQATSENLLTKEFYGLNLMTEAILRLEAVYGQLPCILAKGDDSNIVMENLIRARYGSQNYKDGRLNGLIILDRNIDILTPLRSQRNFAGLMDEVYGFGIHGHFSTEKICFEEDYKQSFKTNNIFLYEKNGKEVLDLTQDCKYYDQFKYFKIDTNSYNNFSKKIRDELKSEAKGFGNENDWVSFKKYLDHANDTQDAFKDIYTKSVVHVTDSEVNEAYILECNSLNGLHGEIYPNCLKKICLSENLLEIYRQLCIESILDDGFEDSIYKNIVKELVESYGLNQEKVLSNLNTANFLKTKKPDDRNIVMKYWNPENNQCTKYKKIKEAFELEQDTAGNMLIGEVGDVLTQLGITKANKWQVGKFNKLSYNIKNVQKVNQYINADEEERHKILEDLPKNHENLVMETEENQKEIEKKKQEEEFQEKISGIEYPYDMIRPLSMKLVEEGLKDGCWENILEKLELIGGKTGRFGDFSRMVNKKDSNGKKGIVAVCVLGGLTYGEAAIIRQISETKNVEILILTSNMINYKQVIEAFFM